jgi:hypothetical protein
MPTGVSIKIVLLVLWRFKHFDCFYPSLLYVNICLPTHSMCLYTDLTCAMIPSFFKLMVSPPCSTKWNLGRSKLLLENKPGLGFNFTLRRHPSACEVKEEFCGLVALSFVCNPGSAAVVVVNRKLLFLFCRPWEKKYSCTTVLVF